MNNRSMYLVAAVDVMPLRRQLGRPASQRCALTAVIPILICPLSGIAGWHSWETAVRFTPSIDSVHVLQSSRRAS
jgi:hypothetical protein